MLDFVMEIIEKNEHGILATFWESEDSEMQKTWDWLEDVSTKKFNNKRELSWDMCVHGSGSILLMCRDTIDKALHDYSGHKIMPFELKDKDKNVRVRVAGYINYISDIYFTLRKLNFAINKDLKEDFVNETVVYFLDNWKKYEFNPNTVPIAVQKYKSLNIDDYRRERKKTNVDDFESVKLPISIKSIEGLPLEELEKKEEFKIMKEAINQMDADCREILMYVADDKSESEIQKILNIPLGTVSSRKSNCIKKLANLLNL
ncbi:sigma-70 family RNA polymerase sigma factor [Pelagibacteraceae bacterium]|nr:sigma-70 family RNA polymerase sigma factor [Pelagibacteraceae bacterium]